jgi:hypothetical protein
LQQNATAADAFNQGMTNVSSMLAYAILTAYNVVGISSIVDVGGGEGTAVLDMPVTIETVNQKLNGKTRGGRCAYIAGDFFDSVPVGADEYLLCGVIHDWDDDQAATILRNCRQAMARTGRVLLVDMVVPENGTKMF